MFALSESSKKVLASVDHRLIEVSELAITITKIDFGHPSSGGLRTAEEQNALYENGKSRCDGFVLKSLHQSGRALDFYAYVDGKASWDDYHLAMVASAFLQSASKLGYSLEWGGLFKNFKDFPHIQII